MKRIMTVIGGLTLVTLVMALLAFAHKQTQRPANQTADVNSTSTSNNAQPKKKGRNLVAKLPAGVNGVTLGDGFIKLKPGYKFVKEKNGRISVNEMKGSGGASVSGTFDCSCAPNEGSGCKLGIVTEKTDSRMVCTSPDLSCTRCDLLVIINATTTKLITYSTESTIPR